MCSLIELTYRLFSYSLFLWIILSWIQVPQEHPIGQIKNILEEILDQGLKIIITSNAHPDDLYQDGLQRQKFIKSMQACTTKLEIFNLKGDIDYRIKNIIDLLFKEGNPSGIKALLSLMGFCKNILSISRITCTKIIYKKTHKKY